MNKKIALAIASSAPLLALIWIVPVQQASAIYWGYYYQCGSGYFQHNGQTWYGQNTCQNGYYVSPKGVRTPLVQIILMSTAYWIVQNGNYYYQFRTQPHVVYQCDVTAYPITCTTF